MARHLMTVCVVCLLCAQHLPCKQHYDDITTESKEFSQSSRDYTSSSPKNYEQNDILNLSPALPPNHSKFYNSHYGNKRKGRTKSVNEFGVNDDVNILRKRVRRHSVAAQTHSGDDHDHEHNNKQSEHFVHQIFKQFGDENQLTMNVLGFEKMLNHLDLYRLLEEQSIDATKNHHIDAVSTVLLV